MKRDTTGGPAFPVVFEHMECTSEQMGMNLRDYFAAAAMQGDLAGLAPDHDWTPYAEKMARRYYAMADAMLKEKDK